MRIVFLFTGLLLGLIAGTVLGLMLGHVLQAQSIYDAICGYDYIVEVLDRADRNSVCAYLRDR